MPTDPHPVPKPSDADEAVLLRPTSPGEIFMAFHWLAVQGFGGVLPVAQRELVEKRRWLTKEDFLAVLSLGQVLPGPNIVNMALIIGQRFLGGRGAFAAVAGLLAAPSAIVLTLAALYGQLDGLPVVAGALRGMGVVAAGLVVSTGIKLLPALRRNPMGLPACLAFGVVTVLGVGVLRWPLVWVVLGLGSLAVATAWWRLEK
jgi:chromate transporter